MSNIRLFICVTICAGDRRSPGYRERSRELRRAEEGEKKKREKQTERKREKCDVAQQETLKFARVASVARFFCGNLMKTVIEYVHYEV